VNRCDKNACPGAGKQAHPGITDVMRDRRARECAGQHQSFEGDIDDTGAFGKQSAESGQQQRRRKTNRREQNRNRQYVAHPTSL
jgi:hypothetical protein